MYRLIVESLLGLRLVTSSEGATLMLAPCLPSDWPGCAIEYRYLATTYAIEMIQTPGASDAMDVLLDGERQPDSALPLRDDGQTHRVVVRLPSAASSATSPAIAAPTARSLSAPKV